MSRSNINLLLLLCGLCFVSCNKVLFEGEKNPTENSTPSFDFPIPSGFDWSIYKQTTVNVIVADQYSGRLDYIVEIYDGDNLLDKGFTDKGGVYNSIVNVESNTTFLTILQFDPNGSKSMVDIPILANKVNVDFANPILNTPSKKANTRALASKASINIPSNAILAENDMTLKENASYYIKEGTTIEGLKLQKKSTLYVAGNYNINPNTNWNNSANIYVTSIGKISGESPKNASKVNIYNEGTVNLAGKLTFSGKIENSSFFTVSSLHLNNDADVEVGGQLNILEKLTSPEAKIRVKNGALLMANNLDLKDCDLILESHAKIMVKNHANFGDSDIEHEDDDNNKAAYAVIIADKLTIEEKDDFEGCIVLDVLEKNITVKNDDDDDDDRWDSSIRIGNPGKEVIQIPANEFNENGYNNGEVGPDPDPLPTPGDIEYLDQVYTIVMEDNFPDRGDMDMNDIVCSWQLGVLKGQKNTVSKIGLRYSVKALGSSKDLAAAVALRGIDKANIKSVTITKSHNFEKYFVLSNNGIEDGNNEVVIPLFEKAHSLFGLDNPEFINVKEITTAPYNFDVIVELNSAIKASEVDFEKINFFLIVAGDKKSREEIHLVGNTTTAKASNDAATFSNNATVWGVQLNKDFSYPIEGFSIEKAYPQFRSWASNGGTVDTDWYDHPEQSIIVKQNIQ